MCLAVITPTAQMAKGQTCPPWWAAPMAKPINRPCSLIRSVNPSSQPPTAEVVAVKRATSPSEQSSTRETYIKTTAPAVHNECPIASMNAAASARATDVRVKKLGLRRPRTASLPTRNEIRRNIEIGRASCRERVKISERNETVKEKTKRVRK